MLLYIFKFHFIFYSLQFENLFQFIYFQFIFLCKITFETIRNIFNLQTKIYDFKLFQKFYNFKLKNNYFVERKYLKLYKNTRRILFYIKITNKFLKLKNIRNLNHFFSDLNYSTIKKAFLRLNMNKKKYNLLKRKNLYFNNKYILIKNFLSDIF